MKIDFSKISEQIQREKIISPDEIFQTLPNKSSKYSYLRDVQGIVLRKWFEEKNRTSKNTIIKMNTGSGKTVVGLLILKSCIAEGNGPAVYVVPDDYLIAQVEKEASELSIETTIDPDSPEYHRGKAILIINIFKLINSKSVFGLRNTNNINIGSIVIDDVHSALQTTDKQFKITVKRNHPLYDKIIALFFESLKNQSESMIKEIINNYDYHDMLVPFWDWKSKVSQITDLIHEYRDNEEIKWNWKLLIKVLPYCKCIVSNSIIEITPNAIPIDIIDKFHNANRRIFMSATLSDDSPFLTHFGVDFNKTNIITPDSANDIGERLILIPQEITPEITDEEMRLNIKEIAKTINVTVIVPSMRIAQLWNIHKNRIINTDNIEKAVNILKQNSNAGIVIFVNRYDGVDLGDDACRLLVLDNLPDIRSKYDIIEEKMLYGSKRIQSEFIQKIEQGMGRSTRSNNDYSGVILMGKRLIRTLYADGGIEHFGSATRKQLELSSLIASEMKNKPIEEILSILDYCFNRNPDWIKTHKDALVKVKYSSEPNINKVNEALTQAFNLARIGEHKSATLIIQDQINKESDNYIKGWLTMHMAEYYNFIDESESQKILRSAKRLNNSVFTPIDGIKTERELKKYSSQAEQLIENISLLGLDSNKFRLKTESILEELQFNTISSTRFEQGIKEIANLIGFIGSRPENEENRGPDNLWRVGSLDFFVIECKNESTNPTISKEDCNQLVGSSKTWFQLEYGDKSCTMTPLMIHCGNTFEYACSPDPSFRIMTPELLEYFKNAVRNFSIAAVDGGLRNIPKLSELLYQYNLTPTQIISSYTTKYIHKI